MCSWKQCLPLSNTSAQRPEVQEHWHSTQMTRATIFYSGPPVVSSALKQIAKIHRTNAAVSHTSHAPTHWMKFIAMGIFIVSHVLLETVSSSVKYQCAKTRGARTLAFDSDDTCNNILFWTSCGGPHGKQGVSEGAFSNLIKGTGEHQFPLLEGIVNLPPCLSPDTILSSTSPPNSVLEVVMQVDFGF